MMMRSPGCEAFEDLDFGHAGGTGADRPAHGDVVLHDVGDAPAAAVEERTTLHLQHVVARLEHDARRQALVLAQPLRHFARETQATGHLALPHLGRHRADFRRVLPCRIGHFRFHPQTEIVRIALRHLELDLEGGQIDDGEERCILRDRGALRDGERADDAVDRRLHAEIADAPLQILDDQPLPVALQATRAQLELQAFLLQAGGFDRVLVIHARGCGIVARLLEVALADEFLAPTNPRRDAARARPPGSRRSRDRSPADSPPVRGASRCPAAARRLRGRRATPARAPARCAARGFPASRSADPSSRRRRPARGSARCPARRRTSSG